MDQNASLAVAGLMESVNFAVNQDGKDVTVTRVMTLMIKYHQYIAYIRKPISIMFKIKFTSFYLVITKN